MIRPWPPKLSALDRVAKDPNTMVPLRAANRRDDPAFKITPMRLGEVPVLGDDQHRAGKKIFCVIGIVGGEPRFHLITRRHHRSRIKANWRRKLVQPLTVRGHVVCRTQGTHFASRHCRHVPCHEASTMKRLVVLTALALAGVAGIQTLAQRNYQPTSAAMTGCENSTCETDCEVGCVTTPAPPVTSADTSRESMIDRIFRALGWRFGPSDDRPSRPSIADVKS